MHTQRTKRRTHSMASTRTALKQIAAHVDESIGMRPMETYLQFSPVAAPQDVGRIPLRKFGKLDVDRIIPDPHQPRNQFNDEEIRRLAAGIRAAGQLHPIRVRWDEDLEQWVIVTGERRWRATLAAGLKQIECHFHDGELTPTEVLEQQLVENLLRQDLSPMEEARGYAALMELQAWNGKQVAQALRVSRSKVSRALALLDLPREVQQQIEAGTVPRSSAYELTKLGNESTQRQLAAQAASGALTQKQASRAVRQRKGKASARTRITKLTFPTESGWTLAATPDSKEQNYHTLEQAALQMLAEIRLRIDNDVLLY